MAGRTGQEYNQRKDRKGAFWEDPYHATAIESGEHLLRCIVYLDVADWTDDDKAAIADAMTHLKTAISAALKSATQKPTTTTEKPGV